MIVFYLWFIPVMVHTVVCYLKLTNWFSSFLFLPAQLASTSFTSFSYMRVVHVLFIVKY